MRTPTIAVTACCIGLAFLAGAWVSYQARPKASGTSRTPLYYVDPMHPGYRSDKPGIAPDCGMQLEPVYVDGGTPAAGSGQLPPGTVQVSAAQMQTIGVKVAPVEKSGGMEMLRVTGRVVPDERRIYRLTAAVDGWVQSSGTLTSGSLVKKNETLLSYYAPDFLAAIQAYIFALGSMDRTMAVQGNKPGSPMEINNSSLHNYQNTLRNLGMSELQLREIAKTREPTENIRIIAPAEGIVLARNVYPGLKFERGSEFYRIANLDKVWVLADTYGAEADILKPGTRVKVSIPKRDRSYRGVVTDVPPIFDPVSRTLKVRLDVDNPGYILRPDMFVDVELPLQLPSMLSVPAEAVLDSGLKKTVFVEKGVGIFEPREVETGRGIGNRVEIVSGLKEGERIAISGTFLLDSESRMKSAASGISGTPRQDPVCGMYVDEAKARAAGLTVDSGGVTYYFCSVDDRNRFLKDPAAKKPMPVSPAPAAQPARPATKKSGREGHTSSPPTKSADEHSGHQMQMQDGTMPPAAPHGSGMKHD